MEGAGLYGRGYRLGPRFPADFLEAVGTPTISSAHDVTSHVQPRSTTTSCETSNNGNLCEKPIGSGDTYTIPIVLGVA